jgi:hypothetical protein
MIDIAPPPAIYDHAYSGTKTVWIEPLRDVQRLCRQLGINKDRIYGCQFWLAKRCYLVIADVPEMQAIYRHEQAHCNGWQHTLDKERK